MEVKLMLIFMCVLAIIIVDPVAADFLYNRPSINEHLGLNCIPGRTVIKISEKQKLFKETDSSSEESYLRRSNTRRKHMNAVTKDEYCRICVCSVDGAYEYCRNRPAMNVNECMMIQEAEEKLKKSVPFEHEKSLAYRIRRDYLWHKDEIPYEPKAACYRGMSYYSNSNTANDTDIDVASDIESLLDYNNKDVCFYCVCAVHGRAAGCISRNPWFCEYFRFIRTNGAARDIYTNTFEQDRPSYFRQLSYRLRRTMDNGIYDFIDTVGHGMDGKKCVPFVSQYTDCTDENVCSGCTRCLCTAEGQWACNSVHQCDEKDQDMEDIDDNLIEEALKTVESELRNKRIKEAGSAKFPLVPRPRKTTEKDNILDEFKFDDHMDDIMSMLREKRSVKKESKTNKSNDTIKFYGAVDEMNEDTLTTSNISGTLQAPKVESAKLPIISRRTGLFGSNNKTLQIEFSKPSLYNHKNNNKFDITGHNDITSDLSHEKIPDLIRNNTQDTKDKELSKLVVDELKKGSETIGDSAAPVISNITFTPENDTLSSVAFIAGNLLHKLWNIEKDNSDTSIETEIIKHEKIANLLDLFKEPLTLKQEMFLKSALAHLSTAIHKTKNVMNISLCENFEEAKRMISESSEDLFTHEENKRKGCKNNEKKQENTKPNDDVISKVNSVMALIQKFDGIQKKINSLKKEPKIDDIKHNKFFSPVLKNNKLTSDNTFTSDEIKSLDQFEKLLKTITGMLYPKNVLNKSKTMRVHETNANIRNKLKNMFDIDLNNLTLSSKDKLIFDYLSHIEENSNCIRSENNHETETRTLASMEGNILLNLSEFFKIKSFSNLVKLLEQKNEQLFSEIATSPKPMNSSTIFDTELSKINNDKKATKLETTKDKLKAHLKTILEDLIEIQNARGLSTQSDIKLLDALPCIYNILNADKEISGNKSKKIYPVDKIATIFDDLRDSLKTVQTRRSNIISGPRPTSAIVWERTIKGLNKKSKSKTRRAQDLKLPKTYEEIKKLIDNVDVRGSNMYKNYALLTEVPPVDKLTLLKTLEVDLMSYIRILEDIKLSLDNLNKLSHDNQTELLEFLENVATNINLNDKVLNNLNKPKTRRYFVDEMNSSRDSLKNKIKKKPALRFSKISNKDDDVKISKDLIINQLIKNRVNLYMKLKEAQGINLEDDINYSIAQKIVVFLEMGNFNIARELYKVFITQNQKDIKHNSSNRHTDYPFLGLNENLSDMTIQQKKPLIQFKEPKTQENPLKWMNQDYLIKQLLNIKGMNR